MRQLLLAIVFCLLPIIANAQVVYDTGSESHTGSTPSQSVTFFEWSHAGAASNVKGILVYTCETNTTNSNVSGVTYNGVSLTEVSGSNATDTLGEPGRIRAWFLGSSVPQGTNTVRVDRTSNTDGVYAVATTVTAGNDTAVVGTTAVHENHIPSEVAVDDGSPGLNSVRFSGGYFGNASVTVGANTTLVHRISLASQACVIGVETTAGQGARSVGFLHPTNVSDDGAGAFLAIKEQSGGGVSSNKSAFLLVGIGGW
jgi:hypothetical protein